MIKVTLIGLSMLASGLLPSMSFAEQNETTNFDVISLKEWSIQCKSWDLWDKPAPPFRIYGNTYYVGTCGIASILIVGEQGHILIDSGTQQGAKHVANNIQALGFRLSDIKLLLNSHEHFDHVGGMAQLQQKTGAPVLTSPEAVPVMKSGKASKNDPQFGMHADFSAVANVKALEESQVVTLDDLILKPIFTPGHTPGALSWQWQSCQSGECFYLVYADSLSPISRDDYRFSEQTEYLKDYREGLNKLAQLRCDILLTPHPSASQMPRRLKTSQGLINRNGCRDYATNVLNRLEKRLRIEAAQHTAVH